MRYVMNKTLERQYVLMSLLLKEKKPISKHLAAELVGCSRPTLDRMIETVKSLIQDFGTIAYTSNGLQMKVSDGFSQRHIRGIILKETFLFRFLTGLLFKEVPSIESWAEDQYVSTSYSYKHLRKVNSFFSNLDIELDTNKPAINLIGNEWQIRYLYFQLFKEVTLIDKEWPFPTLSYPAIKSFVRKICKELELYMNPLQEYQYALFVGVHLLRSKKSSNVIMPEYDYRSWKLINDKHMITPIFTKLEDTLNMELDEKDRYAILRTIECFPAGYLSMQAIQSRIDYAKDLNKESYRIAYEFMMAIEGRPENDCTQFVKYLDIFAFYEFLPLNEEIRFTCDKDNVYSMTNVADQEMVSFVRPILNKLEKDNRYQFVFRHLEQILYKLGIIYQSHKRSISPQEPVKITVLSEKGPEKESYISYLLSDLFSDEVLKIVDNKDISISSTQSEIDLIVADYIPCEVHSSYNWFLLSDCLDTKNRLQLEKEVKRYHSEKNKIGKIVKAVKLGM